MITKSYFIDMGPDSGPILGRHGLYAIGVLRDRCARTRIGMALPADQDHDGRAIWTLTVYDFEVPGRWIVVDRKFRPAR